VSDDEIHRPVYHRFQSAQDNAKMVETGKVGGRPRRNIYSGGPPRVKAFIGPLPPGYSGIEFTTDIPPDRGSPPGEALWAEGTAGVEVLEENELVAIAVTFLKRQD
jgi:hypothetical protein